MATPKIPGFYWAQWRICAPGTADEAEFQPLFHWEVVDVFENASDKDDPEYLRVHVSGVSRGQSIENFVWGPGPLKPPPAVAAA